MNFLPVPAPITLKRLFKVFIDSGSIKKTWLRLQLLAPGINFLPVPAPTPFPSKMARLPAPALQHWYVQFTAHFYKMIFYFIEVTKYVFERFENN